MMPFCSLFTWRSNSVSSSNRLSSNHSSNRHSSTTIHSYKHRHIWTILTGVLCWFRFRRFVLGFLCVLLS